MSTEKMKEATPAGRRAERADCEQVWRALAKASFAVISYVTPAGEPRSSGVVYAAVDRRIFVVIDSDSWKARTIADGRSVAVTVPVRRGGLLSLLMPIPPATISCHARAVVHVPGSIDIGSISKRLERLLPRQGRSGEILELIPEGSFLTYGLGVSLKAMTDPARALARVPVA